VLDENGIEILISRPFKTPNEAKSLIDDLALLGLEAFNISNKGGQATLSRNGKEVGVFTLEKSDEQDPATYLAPRLGGRFVISKRSNGEFQFSLNAGNGLVILVSEGYKTRSSCLDGLASVKKSSQDDKKFSKLTSINGKFYFNLTATNNQVIGTSQMYADERSRDNGITAVKLNSPNAPILDQ
jgi:uncharacterized protein